MDLHDLTAAYALDALDADEAEAYERHLGHCEDCREQLAELNGTATALAFATAAPAPPPRLRESILEAAAAERSNVVPLLRRRWVARGLGVAAAAAAACIVVGLAVSLSRSSGKQVFTVVVRNGHGTLQASGLAAAPSGHTYEMWVIPAGAAPKPAGLFRGGATTTVRLERAVPRGAVIAVTVERAGGVNTPTTEPIFTART